MNAIVRVPGRAGHQLRGPVVALPCGCCGLVSCVRRRIAGGIALARGCACLRTGD